MLEKPNREYPEYRHWKNMRARCNAASVHKHRKHYESIEVCERWDSFENFYNDMGPKPFPKASIDRIDNEGNYTPENCRWATDIVQSRNTSKVTTYTYKGITGCVPELAEHFNIKANSVHKNLYNGMSIEEAIDSLLRDNTITYNGITLTKKQWADRLGIKHSTMYARFSNNTTLEIILAEELK